MMNKQAKSDSMVIIIILLVAVGAGWYFFIYNNGANNPFNGSNSTNNPGGTNTPNFIKGSSCGNTGQVTDYAKTGCTVTINLNGASKTYTYTPFVSLSGSLSDQCSTYGQNQLSITSPEGFILRTGAISPNALLDPTGKNKMNRLFICLNPTPGYMDGKIASLQ